MRACVSVVRCCECACVSARAGVWCLISHSHGITCPPRATVMLLAQAHTGAHTGPLTGTHARAHTLVHARTARHGFVRDHAPRGWAEHPEMPEQGGADRVLRCLRVPRQPRRQQVCARVRPCDCARVWVCVRTCGCVGGRDVDWSKYAQLGPASRRAGGPGSHTPTPRACTHCPYVDLPVCCVR